MFGHQDDNQDNPVNDTLTAPLADGVLEHDQPVTAVAHDDFNPALPASDADQPVVTVDPSNDFSLPTGVSDDAGDTVPPEPVEVAAEEAPLAATSPVTPIEPAANLPASDDLLDIKQQALTQLTPLVDQLDQSPEEKFRTTMMMIQAADNKELVPKAYEAAQAIPDEKVKAQALLDIVNEINYFTQHSA